MKVGKYKYVKLNEDKMPARLLWDVPRGMQGQMVEYAFASPGARDGGCPGDMYCRVTERGGKSEYYQLESAK